MVYRGKDFDPRYDHRVSMDAKGISGGNPQHSESSRGSRGRGRGRGRGRPRSSADRPYIPYQTGRTPEPAPYHIYTDSNGHKTAEIGWIDDVADTSGENLAIRISHRPSSIPTAPRSSLPFISVPDHHLSDRPETPSLTSKSQMSSTPSHPSGNFPLSSPANPNALDSLDKLRQFKATVEASRQAKRSATAECEEGRLAQLAENFLYNQNQTKIQDLTKQQGEMEPGEINQDASTPHTNERSGPSSPRSREAELKERLRRRAQDSPISSHTPGNKRPHEDSGIASPIMKRSRGEDLASAQLPRKPEPMPISHVDRRTSITRPPSDARGNGTDSIPAKYIPTERNFVSQRFRPKGSLLDDDNRDIPTDYRRRSISPRKVDQEFGRNVDYSSRTESRSMSGSCHQRSPDRRPQTHIVPPTEPRSSHGIRDAAENCREIRIMEGGNASYIPPADTRNHPRGSYDSTGFYREDDYNAPSQQTQEKEYRPSERPNERQLRATHADQPMRYSAPRPVSVAYHTQLAPASPLQIAANNEVLATLAALKAQISRLEAQLPILLPAQLNHSQPAAQHSGPPPVLSQPYMSSAPVAYYDPPTQYGWNAQYPYPPRVSRRSSSPRRVSLPSPEWAGTRPSTDHDGRPTQPPLPATHAEGYSSTRTTGFPAEGGHHRPSEQYDSQSCRRSSLSPIRPLGGGHPQTRGPSERPGASRPAQGRGRARGRGRGHGNGYR